MFWIQKKTPVMKAAELAAAMTGGQVPVIVDVRSPKDFEAAHLPGAINIPLEELELRRAELDPIRPTVFY